MNLVYLLVYPILFQCILNKLDPKSAVIFKKVQTSQDPSKNQSFGQSVLFTDRNSVFIGEPWSNGGIVYEYSLSDGTLLRSYEDPIKGRKSFGIAMGRNDKATSFIVFSSLDSSNPRAVTKLFNDPEKNPESLQTQTTSGEYRSDANYAIRGYESKIIEIENDEYLVYGCPSDYWHSGKIYTASLANGEVKYDTGYDNNVPIQRSGFAFIYDKFNPGDQLILVIPTLELSINSSCIDFLSIYQEKFRKRDKFCIPEYGTSFGYSLALAKFGLLSSAKTHSNLVIAGSPFHTKSGINNGSVKLIKVVKTLNPNGEHFELEISEIFTHFGSENSLLGFVVKNIGDIDRNGYEDVISSAPFYKNSMGALYIFYQFAEKGFDAKFITILRKEELNGVTFNFFGLKMDVFDTDNDGLNEVIIGGRGGAIFLKPLIPLFFDGVFYIAEDDNTDPFAAITSKNVKNEINIPADKIEHELDEKIYSDFGIKLKLCIRRVDNANVDAREDEKVFDYKIQNFVTSANGVYGSFIRNPQENKLSRQSEDVRRDKKENLSIREVNGRNGIKSTENIDDLELLSKKNIFRQNERQSAEEGNQPSVQSNKNSVDLFNQSEIEGQIVFKGSMTCIEEVFVLYENYYLTDKIFFNASFVPSNRNYYNGLFNKDKFLLELPISIDCENIQCFPDISIKLGADKFEKINPLSIIEIPIIIQNKHRIANNVYLKMNYDDIFSFVSVSNYLKFAKISETDPNFKTKIYVDSILRPESQLQLKIKLLVSSISQPQQKYSIKLQVLSDQEDYTPSDNVVDIELELNYTTFIDVKSFVNPAVLNIREFEDIEKKTNKNVDLRVYAAINNYKGIPTTDVVVSLVIPVSYGDIRFIEFEDESYFDKNLSNLNSCQNPVSKSDRRKLSLEEMDNLQIKNCQNDSNLVCLEYKCNIERVDVGKTVDFMVEANLDVNKILKLMRRKNSDNEYIRFNLNATSARNEFELMGMTESQVTMKINKVMDDQTLANIPFWIYAIAILSAVVLLAIVVFTLYKVGFFKRKMSKLEINETDKSK